MPQFICGNCLFLLKSANVLKKKILISNDYILNERKIQIK